MAVARNGSSQGQWGVVGKVGQWAPKELYDTVTRELAASLDLTPEQLHTFAETNHMPVTQAARWIDNRRAIHELVAWERGYTCVSRYPVGKTVYHSRQDFAKALDAAPSVVVDSHV